MLYKLGVSSRKMNSNIQIQYIIFHNIYLTLASPPIRNGEFVHDINIHRALDKNVERAPQCKHNNNIYFITGGRRGGEVVVVLQTEFYSTTILSEPNPR